MDKGYDIQKIGENRDIIIESAHTRDLIFLGIFSTFDDFWFYIISDLDLRDALTLRDHLLVDRSCS